MERTPSSEQMPPPTKPTTSGRDKSTGYSSSMSDNSPKYAKSSPGRSSNHQGYPKPKPNFEGHRRSKSERRKSESENLELPQIQVQRLMPTKIKTNKTVCSIRPDEKAYIEYLDEKQLVCPIYI